MNEPRPPCDELWAAIAAPIVFSVVLKDGVAGREIGEVVDRIYKSVTRVFELRTSGQVVEDKKRGTP